MAERSTPQLRQCRVCGAALQNGYRYCPSCGTAAPLPPPDADPSTLETREFHVSDVPGTETVRVPPGESRVISSSQLTRPEDPQRTWPPPDTTVPPESGNRTLWIILGIVAFIILMCCCVLPLGLMTITSFDSTFQDDLRSLATFGSG